MITAKAFVIIRDGFDSKLIIHGNDGAQTEVKMQYDDLKELMLLTAHAFDETQREAQEEWEYEARLEAQHEEQKLLERERELEQRFSDQGHDSF